MVNIFFYVLVGSLVAYFHPFGGDVISSTAYPYSRDIDQSFNGGAFFVSCGMFIVGMIIASVVRFIAPKRVHIITLLGTKPIQQLNTGVNFTLPWPFGYTHAIVPTDVQDMPIEVQVKPKDNLVYNLPVNVQWFVFDALLYAIERNNPQGQAENILTAAIRKAANSMTLFDMYEDKDQVQKHAEDAVSAELASMGIRIQEIVVQDPDLPGSTATKLSAIREAELDKEAAIQEALATFERMVGAAKAEAASTRLKGAAVANLRLLIAEGNAAAVAVMQGKLAISWEDETVGEGKDATTIKVARFVQPEVIGGVASIPEIDIDPSVILEFFKIVDSNDAIRDAAAHGNTVVLSTGSNSDTGTGMSAATFEKLIKSNSKETT